MALNLWTVLKIVTWWIFTVPFAMLISYLLTLILFKLSWWLKVIIIKTKVVVKAVTYLRLFECNFGFEGRDKWCFDRKTWSRVQSHISAMTTTRFYEYAWYLSLSLSSMWPRAQIYTLHSSNLIISFEILWSSP